MFKKSKILKISDYMTDIYRAQSKNPENYAVDKNTKQFLFYDWSQGCWDSVDMKTVLANLQTLKVQELSFEVYNQRNLDGFTYYLSKEGCSLTWNNLTNTWSFEENYIENLEFIHKIRRAYLLRSHLFSFTMPNLVEIADRYNSLKLSISKDSSPDLALNLKAHLHVICPLLASFLNSRFSYYNDQVTQESMVNYLINYLCLLRRKNVDFVSNSSNVPQKIHAFVGPGQSGKSTFCAFIQSLLTDGAIKATSLSVLRNDTRFETYHWLGKTAIMIQEVENQEEWRQNLGFFKAISGNDLVPYEIKFGTKGQSRIAGSIILTSNSAINPSTKSEYISQYRRLVNIHFNESIPKDRAQLNFSEQLSKEVPSFILFSHFLETFKKNGF